MSSHSPEVSFDASFWVILNGEKVSQLVMVVMVGVLVVLLPARINWLLTDMTQDIVVVAARVVVTSTIIPRVIVVMVEMVVVLMVIVASLVVVCVWKVVVSGGCPMTTC